MLPSRKKNLIADKDAPALSTIPTSNSGRKFRMHFICADPCLPDGQTIVFVGNSYTAKTQAEVAFLSSCAPYILEEH